VKAGIYRLLLRLLPEWLEARAGAEMLALYEAKLDEARVNGTLATARLVARETLGLLRVILASRLGGPSGERRLPRPRISWLDFKLGFRMPAAVSPRAREAGARRGPPPAATPHWRRACVPPT
jgi:hypothetical protein